MVTVNVNHPGEACDVSRPIAINNCPELANCRDRMFASGVDVMVSVSWKPDPLIWIPPMIGQAVEQ